MSRGSSEVCFVPFSGCLKASGGPASTDRGQTQGQRGADYSRFTSDKRVGSVICGDPSCGRLQFLASVVDRG